MNIANGIGSKIRLGDLTKQLSQKLNENDCCYEKSSAELLKNHFSSSSLNECPEKIYGRVYSDFFLRYGIANILKNYYLLSELDNLGLMALANEMLDIGAGPGTFALANLLWGLDHPHECDKKRKLVMTDCAEESLSLFKNIWEGLDFKTKDQLDIIPIQRLENGSYPNEIRNPNLLVFSNSLSEMLRDSRIKMDKLVSSIIESQALVFIVDYKYEKTSQLFRDFTDKLLSHYKSISYYNWPKFDNFFSQVDLGKIENRLLQHYIPKANSNVKFIKSLLIPKGLCADAKRPIYSKIVSRYKEAWENHDLNVLQGLFTEDAKYEINKIRAPLCGLNEIITYWEENSREQCQVEFNPIFVRGNKSEVYCTWTASFYRVDKNAWMKLNGTFEAKLINGKISYFSEDFQKQMSSQRLL